MSSRVETNLTENLYQFFAAYGANISKDLLLLALTHRSYAYENGGLPTNERLEFLGDAVLEIVITEYLYKAFPVNSEGQLAKMRSSIVNTQALAKVAKTIGESGLGEYILLGKGEVNSGGRVKASILADTLEALIGALYLSCSLAVTETVIIQLFTEIINISTQLGANLDWKTSLQELMAANDMGSPTYFSVATGPDHDKRFTAEVFIYSNFLGAGKGRTKKEAQQNAAEVAYKKIQTGQIT